MVGEVQDQGSGDPDKTPDSSIKIGIPGFDEMFEGNLPTGTTILIIAPPIFEARILGLQMIYNGLQSKEGGLVVTTDDSPENIMKKLTNYQWSFDQAMENQIIRWVDTFSLNANKDVTDTKVIKRVGGPVALSDMAIAISEAQASFFKSELPSFRALFDSLSTLLMYSAPETVYYFLQSVIPKIKNANGVGFFMLSSGMHDPKIEMTIRHLMDGTLQIDDDLNMKIISFPTMCKQKTGKLVLDKNGFTVQP